MKVWLVCFCSILILGGMSTGKEFPGGKGGDTGPITLVIHGGAGTIKKENMTPEKEKAYKDALQVALDSGYAVLKRGGKSTDAVIAAIKIMEDHRYLTPEKARSLQTRRKMNLMLRLWMEAISWPDRLLV